MISAQTATHAPADVRRSRAWADHYRSLGYNAIPSRPDEKRPFLRWSEWAEEPVPAELFDRFGTANIQVMCGRRWRLAVIDLDGPEAVEHWPSMGTRTPRTWVTHSGGEGRHLWFTVAPDGPPVRSGRLWGEWDDAARDGRGDWRKHVGVELIGDRKLIMAPPSIHPTTGRRYRFLDGHSPKDVGRPAALPAWILAMPIVQPPRPEYVAPAPAAEKAPSRPATGRFNRNDVLDAIGDKVALAGSWGLRVASSRPNASGWCECHAIGREDRNPSASFHAESGRYWEADGGSMSLFDLGVTLGRFSDWREAVNELGATYHARQDPSPRYHPVQGITPS